MAHMPPLPKNAHPELAASFATFERILGFVPNSLLTMQPNAVIADHFARLRQHWTDDQIVEMLAAVCLYGFLNRWNDTMATELEEGPREVGERYLSRTGWNGGKHVAD
jgi:hypothetical protein